MQGYLSDVLCSSSDGASIVQAGFYVVPGQMKNKPKVAVDRLAYDILPASFSIYSEGTGEILSPAKKK